MSPNIYKTNKNISFEWSTAMAATHLPCSTRAKAYAMVRAYVRLRNRNFSSYDWFLLANKKTHNIGYISWPYAC